MSLTLAATSPAGDALPEERTCVGTYPDAAAGFEHSLVVLAMGHPCWLESIDGACHLLVERPLASAAAAELSRFDRESLAWPPAPPLPAIPERRPTRLPTALWALALLVSFWAQSRFPTSVEYGALDAAGVFTRREWWRPVTALFLHGDSGHLLSNLGAGILTFLAVGSTFGAARGWLLLALSATAGNLLAAALQLPGPYQSVGASTAVFAGLGLLVGWAAIATHPPGAAHPWRRVLLPLGAGAVLFALHGGGGARVDFGAHVSGFVCGLAAGGLTGIFSARGLHRSRA